MPKRVVIWAKHNYYVWMPYVVMFLLVLCGFAYTNYAIHKSEHEMCGLLQPLDQANHTTKPSTAFGRAFAAELHRQVTERGC